MAKTGSKRGGADFIVKSFPFFLSVKQDFNHLLHPLFFMFSLFFFYYPIIFSSLESPPLGN